MLQQSFIETMANTCAVYAPKNLPKPMKKEAREFSLLSIDLQIRIRPIVK